MTQKGMSEEDDTSTTNWKKIRAVAFARAFSFLGSELTIFALVLREKESGAATVSALFILGTLPFILFAPWAGLIADRFSTRKVILISSLIQAGLIFSLTVEGPRWLVFATLFLANGCGSVANPSWGALIPTLSTKDDLPRTMGFSQTIFALAGLVSPALGGYLVSTSGFYWPFVIDSASFLLIAFMPFVLRVNRPGIVKVEGEKSGAMDGLRFLFQEPLLRALLILLTVFILALGVVNVGEVFLVTQVLGASPFIYGLVGTSFAVGALVGASWVASYKAPEERHVHVVIYGLVALAIAVLGISLAWNWEVVLFFSLLAGMGNSIINSYGVGIFINNSDQAIQGRVLAGVNGVINIGMIAAMGIAGVLIGFFGVREVLLGGAVLSLAVLALLSPGVFRRVPKIA